MSVMRFDNIIGQETAARHLQNALRTGQVSQAYLFCGEKGSGRMALARTFAAALQCTGRQSLAGEEGTEPCGKCHSCIQMESGSHPDVITVTNELAGAQGKTDTVSVKTVRFIQSDVVIKPYEGPYKIYIVPDAQKMNQQAQNALLKTLEDPPSYVVVLLLAEDTSGFLPTVLSRCVTLRLHPVPEEKLIRAMKDAGIADRSAVIAARLSHGNPGRCRELAENGELEAFRLAMTAFLKRMPDVGSWEVVQYAGQLSAKKEKKPDGDAGGKRAGVQGNPPGVSDFLDMGQSWFRDLLVAKSTGSAENLIFQDEVTYIINTASGISYQALETILNAFDEAERRRRANGNDVQIMEVLLLKIRSSMRM